MNQDQHFHAAARDGHPLISVVVPSYNHGRYIKDCLDALMFQDYPNLGNRHHRRRLHRRFRGDDPALPA